MSEIPYQVPKARVVEKLTALLAERKLTLLGDVRDESAEGVRIVLEPKSRTVEPQTLMESLFRLTDLEVRVGLNMNVLDGDNVPRVMTLREVLRRSSTTATRCSSGAPATASPPSPAASRCSRATSSPTSTSTTSSPSCATRTNPDPF